MSIDLFDLTWRCAVELGVGRHGTATGGSVTTIVDTNGLANIDNDYYNEGTAWVLKTDDAELPQGTFSVVSDFASSNKTLTLQTTLTAIEAGDVYGVAPRRYPLYLLTQKINNALYLDGYIPVEDTTSITLLADQTEYTLPAGASRDLRQVMVATTTDSNKNLWAPVHNWRIQHTTTGTADTLVLAYQLPAGYTLLLRYATAHAVLRDADDVLNEVIHPDRVVFQACADAMRWYRDKTRLRNLDSTIEMLEKKTELAKERHPLPPLPARQARIMRVTRTLRMD